ncbi:MAG TPA: hypothetical protein PK629_03790 [Oscillospiraceae bacterium]|nr:hypothetical protein [Oscillospiraceae bacterium]HPF55520.1 hypothetical protein [Clostridiales bacterium]HPK35706.1 hypothetical protein [Oscillospiraceae bacterium]HPR76569.1 hypothetical protein [Oscillospiraceae bacterium]
MKKALMILCCLILLQGAGFTASASTGVSFTVREDKVEDESVSFVWRHPRIYGLYDTETMKILNQLLKEEGQRAYLEVRYRAMSSNERATGEVIVENTCNSGNMICFCFQTDAIDGSGTRYDSTRYLCLDTSSGKQLGFWDLFIKDGAKREAVLEIFGREVRERGEPESQWVLKKMKSIGAMSYFADDEIGVLTVLFNDQNGNTVRVSVKFSDLTLFMKPEYTSVTKH